MNQKDGFVLLFILAFHIFLKTKTTNPNSVNKVGSVGFHIIEFLLKYQLLSSYLRDLENKKLIDMLQLRVS